MQLPARTGGKGRREPIDTVPPDVESRLRLGLSELLAEHPELRDALPLAVMTDDSVRWCA